MTVRQRDVILGLICLHPGVTGYELRAIIERSTGYFYSASLSQIYPVLKTLLVEDLVIVEEAGQEGGRVRKHYSSTEKGHRVHQEWLASPVEFENSLSDFRTFLLRYTFIVAADTEIVRAFLTSGLAHFQSERARIAADSLATERDYIIDLPNASQYLIGWQHEIAFLLADLDRKIEWIGDALALVGQDAASHQGHTATAQHPAM
jgi:DNA-binding PadR family transcriptional regulator